MLVLSPICSLKMPYEFTSGNSAPSVGPQAIEKIFKTQFESGFRHIDLVIDQVSPFGTDAAITVGRYEITGRGQGGPLKVDGRWTELEVREGGVWKIRHSAVVPKIEPNPIAPRMEVNSVTPGIEASPITPRTEGDSVSPRIAANSVIPGIEASPIAPRTEGELISPRIAANSVTPGIEMDIAQFGAVKVSWHCWPVSSTTWVERSPISGCLQSSGASLTMGTIGTYCANICWCSG